MAAFEYCGEIFYIEKGAFAVVYDICSLSTVLSVKPSRACPSVAVFCWSIRCRLTDIFFLPHCLLTFFNSNQNPPSQPIAW